MHPCKDNDTVNLLHHLLHLAVLSGFLKFLCHCSPLRAERFPLQQMFNFEFSPPKLRILTERFIFSFSYKQIRVSKEVTRYQEKVPIPHCFERHCFLSQCAPPTPYTMAILSLACRFHFRSSSIRSVHLSIPLDSYLISQFLEAQAIV